MNKLVRYGLSDSYLLLSRFQEDTFLLWKEVVSNRLLAKVTIVLFMNKIDILNVKITQGVDVRKYVPRFEGNVRSSDEVIRCTFSLYSWDAFAYVRADFKAKFKAIHKRYSPQPRAFHCFPTSAIVRWFDNGVCVANGSAAGHASDVDYTIDSPRANRPVQSRASQYPLSHNPSRSRSTPRIRESTPVVPYLYTTWICCLSLAMLFTLLYCAGCCLFASVFLSQTPAIFYVVHVLESNSGHVRVVFVLPCLILVILLLQRISRTPRCAHRAHRITTANLVYSAQEIIHSGR